MTKVSLFLALWLSLVALCPLSSTAESAGVIQGSIVNGTVGGGSVGSLGVELHTFSRQSATGEPVEGERLQSKADAQGQFRFEGLSTVQDSVYQLEATYQGVAYSSAALQFEPGIEQLTVELWVYETTAQAEDITVSRAHLLLDPAETTLVVTELYLLANFGDRTYIGQQEVQGRRWTSSYQLPSGAHDVVFQDGAWGGRFLQIEGGLVDTEPLWPGQTTVIFTYSVDCPTGSCNLGRTLQQRLSKLNVLVPDTGATVNSAVLAAQGVMDAQGRSYLNFVASDLAPGIDLDLHIVLPRGVHSSVPANPTGRGSALPWIILGVVASVAFLGYPFWRQHIQGQAVGDRSHISRHLDDGH